MMKGEMPASPDRLPLIPPALKRLPTAVTDHFNPGEQHSDYSFHEADLGLDWADAHKARSLPQTNRPAKSTIHGVVSQFSQLHHRKSAVDRIFSSIGRAFRRICHRDVRSVHLEEDYVISDSESPIPTPQEQYDLSVRERVGQNLTVGNEKKKQEESEEPIYMMVTFQQSESRDSANAQTKPRKHDENHRRNRWTSASAKQWMNITGNNKGSVLRRTKRYKELDEKVDLDSISSSNTRSDNENEDKIRYEANETEKFNSESGIYDPNTKSSTAKTESLESEIASHSNPDDCCKINSKAKRGNTNNSKAKVEIHVISYKRYLKRHLRKKSVGCGVTTCERGVGTTEDDMASTAESLQQSRHCQTEDFVSDINDVSDIKDSPDGSFLSLDSENNVEMTKACQETAAAGAITPNSEQRRLSSSRKLSKYCKLSGKSQYNLFQ